MFTFKAKKDLFPGLPIFEEEDEFIEIEIYTNEEFSRLSLKDKKTYSEDERNWFSHILNNHADDYGIPEIQEKFIKENCIEDFKKFLKDGSYISYELDDGDEKNEYGITQLRTWILMNDFIVDGFASQEIIEKYYLRLSEEFYSCQDDEMIEMTINNYGYDLKKTHE